MKDLKDSDYGRWKVLHFSHKTGEGRSTTVYWMCECKCGTKKPVRASSLTGGKSISCGCHLKEMLVANSLAKREDANRNRPEYANWLSMRRRCTQESNASYERYGEVGITVCPEWDDFKKFLEDMGPKPSPMHTIDRIESTKGYYKENCRWATPVEQVRSRSVTTMITYKGETKPLAEWAEILNIKYVTLKKRLFIEKLGVEEAFEKPVRQWKPKGEEHGTA